MAVAVPLALGAFGAWAAPAGYAALGFSIGSAIGSYLVAPTIKSEGPRLTDNAVQGSQYGVPIPRIHGRVVVKGQVIWSSGLIEHAHTEDVGGKGSSSVEHTTYTYTASFAVLLCEGEIDAVRRIWMDGGLIYDVSDTADLATFYQSHELFKYLNIYLGSESQEADPVIQAYVGIDDTPAYRGWAMLVFEDLDVTRYGRIPVIEVEVVDGVSPGWELFEGTGDGYRHTSDLLQYDDGVDDLRVIDGSLRFTAPNDDGIGSDRYNSTELEYTGNEYLVPISESDQPTQQAYRGPEYGNIPGYKKTYSWLMGRIGSSRVISDRPDSMVDSHPWGSAPGTQPYMRIEDEFYYNNRQGAFPVCSNDHSILMVWVFDRDESDPDFQWTLKVYDSSLALLHSEVNPDVVIKNRANVANSACIDKGRFLWYQDTTANTLTIYEIETDYSLTVISSTELNPDFDNEGMGYVANNIFFHVDGTHWKASAYGRLDPDAAVDLADVVSAICIEAGLSAGDIDVTDLSGIDVEGYRISNVSSARSQIEPLQLVYHFDAAEINGKIVFIRRGGSPSGTLTVDELGAGVDSPQSEALDVVRGQESELPRRVTVAYIGKEIDGEIGEQHASRVADVEALSEVMIELPIMMADAPAAQVAEIQLYNLWQQRTRLRFATNDTTIKPCDVRTLDVDGVQYVVRILSVDYQSVIGPMVCEAVLEDPSIYSPVASGSATSSTGQTVSPLGPTQIELIDGSLLQSSDSDAGVYVAVAGYYDAWPGAVLMISTDDASWAQWAAITAQATMGSTTDTLADADTHVPDEVNTVTVALLNGTLSTITEAQWLNGNNIALIGDEVVLFRTATLISTGIYELSGLIRGVKGTEWATDTHDDGDSFVLIDQSTMRRITLSDDQIGVTQYIKPVTIGSTIEETKTVLLTYAGNGYKPYAPAHLTATDVGGGDYDLTWVRRGRKSGEWRDYVDVPLNEESESYRVEVWRTGSLLSTTDVSTESATVAAVATDVIKVAQISAVVGAGHYSEVTL